MLFEWLTRTSTLDHPAEYVDKAERVALWNLECLLERVLVEPFDVNYAEQVRAGAVLEELSTLKSAETRKGAAQARLAMARLLDNPLTLT